MSFSSFLFHLPFVAKRNTPRLKGLRHSAHFTILPHSFYEQEFKSSSAGRSGSEFLISHSQMIAGAGDLKGVWTGDLKVQRCLHFRACPLGWKQPNSQSGTAGAPLAPLCLSLSLVLSHGCTSGGSRPLVFPHGGSGLLYKCSKREPGSRLLPFLTQPQKFHNIIPAPGLSRWS